MNNQSQAVPVPDAYTMSDDPETHGARVANPIVDQTRQEAAEDPTSKTAATSGFFDPQWDMNFFNGIDFPDPVLQFDPLDPTSHNNESGPPIDSSWEQTAIAPPSDILPTQGKDSTINSDKNESLRDEVNQMNLDIANFQF
jgi:hypothetical protein